MGLLFLMAFGESYGQFHPLSEQYTLDALSINPAYAGRREALSIAMSYRHQWVGFEGAPRTEIISMHSPFLKQRPGIGLVLMNNKMGIKQETGVFGNYSYSFKTGPGKLSLGLGAGVSITNKNPHEYRVLDQGDEAVRATQKNFIMPDFSAGVYYYTDRYYAGISAPFFMNHRFSPASGEYEMYHSLDDSNYMVMGGYLWEINESVKLFPNALLRFKPNRARQVDLNLHVIVKDKFWLGTNYRSEKGIIWTLQYQINNQFRLAYSYGTDFSELGRYNRGTHEIMLRYDFKYLLEVVSPRYF
ncbi:MAG: type IX secretion system membrane protein PorP/SprF [Bacteroidales bacterium]|nr:type IX secretion system membrane protein PorP/SprF [Bacteroidales bacterium]